MINLNRIIILFIVIFLYLLCYNNKENFYNYIDNLKDNNNTMKLFCSKLRLLDTPNEHNMLLKKFNTEIIKKRKEQIKDLEDEIENLYKTKTQSYIDKKNNHKLNTHIKAIKQLEVIEKAKENIANRNTIKLNII